MDTSRDTPPDRQQPAHGGRAPRRDLPRGRPKTAQAVTVALIVVTLVTAVFVIQNTRSTKIEFLFWSANVALAGALLLAAALGGLLAFLVAYIRYRQFRHALRRERNRPRSGVEADA